MPKIFNFMRIRKSTTTIEGGQVSVGPPVETPAEPTTFDRLAAWVLIIGTFLLPIFFLVSIEGPVEFAKILIFIFAIIFSLLFWLIARLQSGIFVLPRSILIGATLLLAALVFLATLFSPVFDVSFGGFVFESGTFASLLFLVLSLILIAVLFQNRQYLFAFYATVLASFVLVALFHIGRLFFGTDFLSFGIFSNSVSSPVGKWNDVAVFSGLAALLSLLTLEFSSFDRRGIRVALHVVLIAALVLLSLVNFFLVWILVGTIALVTLVYNVSFSQFLKGDNASRRFSFSSILVLLIATLFLIFGTSLGTSITDRFNISHVEVRPSWDSTFAIAKKTWSEEGFLTGGGPARFSSQWLQYKPNAVNETVFWNTDFSSAIGLLPTFAITSGLLGTLGWLLFLLAFVFFGIRSIFSSEDRELRYYALSSFIIALYLWIIALFYVPGTVLFALAFLFTGVFIAVRILQGDSRNIVFSVVRDPRIGFVSVLVLIILLVGTVIGGYAVFQKYLALTHFYDGRVALQNNDLETARTSLGKAINANEHDSIYRVLAEARVAELNEILSRRGVSIESIRGEFQNALGGAIQAGQNAVNYDETNYQNWFTLARVYSVVVPLQIPGAHENARASFERARELNPRGPQLLFEQARMEASRGNTEEAQKLIEEALSMRSTYTDALFLSAQIDINEGNVAGAISSLERASLINPNDVGLFFRLGLLKYNREDFSGAIVALERAVALSPDYSNAKYFLGLSYYNNGNKESAIREFERIRELNPDNNEVVQILENMGADLDPFVNIIPPNVSPEEREEPPIDE